MKQKIKKTLKNKKVRLGIAIALVLVTGVIIYKVVKDKKDTSVSEQSVITATVEQGSIKQTVSASGQIETANYLSVTTSVNGIVNKVYVKEGDVVTKGQAIMDITLNSDGEENLASALSSYLSAKNSLDSANTQLISYESSLLNAKEDLDDEKEDNSYQSHEERVSYTLAENAYEIAQGNYDNHLSSISQKQVALNKAWLTYQAQYPTIVAPGDGVIANIVVVEGMDITNSLSERTSATVASIKREGTPIASLNISEVDINKVQVGQKVELTLNSIPNETFVGEVVGIDKIGTISSGVSNYPVIVKFEKDSNLVLPNMGVDADIIIEQKEDAVYVPSSAIISMKGRTMIRVQDGEEVKSTQVEIGVVTSEYTEIISGVDLGTTVLINTLPTAGFTNTDNQEGRSGPSIMPGTGGGRR